MNTTIINLFGPPGSGKSTCAAYLFARLKMLGIDAELVTEFTKDKVWEDSLKNIKNQCYVFGEQSFRISRCLGKVKYIITDSPLPLSIIYKSESYLDESFDKTVMNVFNSCNNLNYYLESNHSYSEVGRIHSKKESENLGQRVIQLLEEQSIDYRTFSADLAGYDSIFNEVLNHSINCSEGDC